ncbi:MAG: DnaA N-terminal domain-containing protein, partial [Pseudomonadota bacterium]
MDKARTTRRNADEDLMEDAEAVNLAADWSDISTGLRKDLGHQLHSQWIKPIQVGDLDRETGTLNLFLPTEFSANWVKDRFEDRLQLAWTIARPEVRQIAIQVHPGRRQLPELRIDDGRRPANDGASAIAVAAGTIGDAGFTSSVGLDPSLTFAAFVTGEANVLACNAAQRMA